MYNRIMIIIVTLLCIFNKCTEDVTYPEFSEDDVSNGSNPIAYSGTTDQNLLIWLMMDNYVIKKISFQYIKSTTIIDGSEPRADSLAALINNTFSYTDANGWTISGKFESGKFTGDWNTMFPLQSGTWSAEQSKSLIVDRDSLFLNIGQEMFVQVECGSHPFCIIAESNSDIATVTAHQAMIEEGLIIIKALGKGISTIKIGDSSYKQLSVVIVVIVN